MQKSKSALFLMELIIVILFFALTSAVCMQVFVKAHLIAEDTNSMNQAILAANNAAESFFEYSDEPAKVESIMAESFHSKDYTYNLAFTEDENYRYMTFNFYKNGRDDSIYTRTFLKHIPEVSD